MRLVNAEVLKIVRRRGTMIWCALLTVGSVVIANIILISLHAANASRHGPAGGMENFRHISLLLSGLGGVAAIVLGAAAGSQDASSGVLRDLVVTGRPRKTLFRVRFPGALLAFMPLLAIGFGVTLLGAWLFAGDLPEPSGSQIGRYAAYLTVTSAMNIGIAIGLAAFIPSRVVVGVMIAWNAIVSHLLIAIGSLGGARRFINEAAAQHLLPRQDQDTYIAMSTATALLVILVWIAVFQRVGQWWTDRRDI
jgi:ABC-type transport system involved in multi-copper enzyme maturation permease subunit